MSERDEQGRRPGAGASRRQRLAAALRDNLAKRKAQARARRSAATDTADADLEAGNVPSGGEPPPDDDPSASGH